jgi:glutamyl-tRNA(Gln) amidotransferase subunit D
MGEKLSGYKGEALKLLREAEVEIGDLLRISRNGEKFQGALIPRSELGDEKHIVIKLENGYNIGIRITRHTKVEKIGKGAKPTFSTPPLPKQNPKLPRVAILSTGGTIASRVDYRTGGVRSALTANDLYSVVPELSGIAIINAEILLSIFSENIAPKHWSLIARQAASHVEKGVAGVVVAHGTDTMGYTAAALSFALHDLPVPVVLVGSQRSADRPSSDAATNLIGATRAAAAAPFAEVTVAMHETISDAAITYHRGTKARKCHTSRRDAFKSVNMTPLARLESDQIVMLTDSYRERNAERKLILKPTFEEQVALVKFHPGMDDRAIEWYTENGFKGIVLEGTGLGHVGRRCFPAIEKAVEKNVLVAMTSQCIWGRIDMNVYDTGRDLLAMGVIPLEDMLPETALVKMMWVLKQTKSHEEARTLLTKNIANEFSDRTGLEATVRRHDA